MIHPPHHIGPQLSVLLKAFFRIARKYEYIDFQLATYICPNLLLVGSNESTENSEPTFHAYWNSSGRYLHSASITQSGQNPYFPLSEQQMLQYTTLKLLLSRLVLVDLNVQLRSIDSNGWNPTSHTSGFEIAKCLYSTKQLHPKVWYTYVCLISKSKHEILLFIIPQLVLG